MFIVGLTGGIGSGKTTVAHLFAQLGVAIIDADEIAKTLTVSGTPAFQAIVDHFGDEILQSTGNLNRHLLRIRIFQDDNERSWLEHLLHPLIIKEIQVQIKIQASTTHLPYIIVVIPLLIETGPYEWIDRILVVDISDKLQLSRLQERDKTFSLETLKAIKKNQASSQHSSKVTA